MATANQLQLTIEDVYREFTARLGRLCIAGGAVRDTLIGRTPKDYDLYVWDGDAETILAGLSGLAYTVGTKSVTKFPVAHVEWSGLQIDIMQAYAPTVDGILDGFDWNVCLFAYDGATMLPRCSLGELEAGNSLRLQTVSYPLLTLRRGFSFAARYNLQLDDDTIISLSRLIAKK